MPEKIYAKYVAEDGGHFMGVPARDLYESDWERLTDEQKAMIGAKPPEGVKPVYQLRHDAPAEAEKASKRVEKAPEPAAPMAEAALADMPPAPEPKDSKK